MAFKIFKHHFFSEKLLIAKSDEFRSELSQRRSIRKFSKRSVPIKVITNIIMTAASAPSGANKQPWTFVIVKDQDIKNRIRVAAEKEEKALYDKRASKEWLADLEPLGTDWKKPFLNDAPYLIVVFKKIYGIDKGNNCKHYYVSESVGIACGFLLTAIHKAGLVALTHTPSPMRFLSDILKRPKNERAFLLIPVGYPAKDAKVPLIKRKKKKEILEIY